MNEREILLKKFDECPNRPLKPFLEQLLLLATVSEDDKTNLKMLCSFVLERAVPEDDGAFIGTGMRPETYISKCISYCAVRIYNMPRFRENAALKTLIDAIVAIHEEGTLHPFDPPKIEKDFDFTVHDASLSHFRRAFLQHLKLVLESEKSAGFQDCYLRTMYVCYARANFDLRLFQAPPRLSPAEANKDSESRDHFWADYLEMWGVNIVETI
jgi:hypothetical protein